MEALKIGFIPAHRNLMDEEYARNTADIFIEKIRRLKQVNLIIPGDDECAERLVRSENDARRFSMKLQKEKPDALLIGAITYGDEKSVLSIVENFNTIPVFLFAVKDPEIPNNEYFKSAASAGAIPIAFGLHKRNVKFTFGGIYSADDNAFIADFKSFLRVTGAFTKFKGARIGSIGTRPNDFEVCAVNENLMTEKYGQKIFYFDLLDIKARMDAIPDSDALVKKIADDILKDVITDFPAKNFIPIAKLEIVLSDRINEYHLDALTIQCWTSIQEHIGITPCLTNGRITQMGIPVGCEGDIHGSLTMLIQHALSSNQSTPLFLDVLMQHPEESNLFLAWHCGNPGIINKDPSIPAHVRSHCPFGDTMGKEKGLATMEFRIKPGIVSINRLTEHHGRFKMLHAVGNMIPKEGAIRGGWSWVELKDRRKFYDTIFNEGFTHHVSIIHGDVSSEIEKFCGYFDIELITV